MADEGRILGSEEFVAETKHRIGEIARGARPQTKTRSQLDPEALMSAVETVTGLKRCEFCSAKKTRALVMAKEAMIIVGHELGASYAGLAKLIGVDSSVVSRRFELGKAKISKSQEARRLVKRLQTEMARTE